MKSDSKSCNKNKKIQQNSEFSHDDDYRSLFFKEMADVRLKKKIFFPSVSLALLIGA